MMNRRQCIAPASGALALALALTGCGSASPYRAPSAAVPAAVTPKVAPSAASATLHIRILSPRPGAHTGQTVTVRVMVIGGTSARLRGLRYILDHGRAKHGSGRLTFHGLAPGRHRLVVTLGSVRSSRTFVVRAPPAPSPAPAQTPTRTPMPATTSAPAPVHTPPTMPTSTTPTPTTPSGGIPQQNGGDHDSDNNGGPSDGDGNI